MFHESALLKENAENDTDVCADLITNKLSDIAKIKVELFEDINSEKRYLIVMIRLWPKLRTIKH